MAKVFCIAPALVAVSLLLAAAPDSQPQSQPAATSLPASQPVHTPLVVDGVDVDALVSGLTVEQKVGQLMFVDFIGKKMNPQIADLLANKRVGGVALFSHNIANRRQVRRLLKSIYQLDMGGIPPFISVDQEGGDVARIKNPEAVLPSAMSLGATRSEELAKTAGRVVGRDLRSLGFTMNLAPVLDVNSNPKNPVIGIRSLGEKPELVAHMGLAFIEGLQQAGVVAVAKHFPGHGATTKDSHYGLPSLPYDLERLRRVEFIPFAHTINGGLEALMTAHIALPKIAEAPDLPATLSRKILTDALRTELGFDGIVITDGLEMRGIVQKYGLGRAAVMSILAGADMVLVVWTAERKEEVRQELLAAVNREEISLQRLDTSVRRILRAKARHHILRGQKPISTQVPAAERRVNDVIAMRGATLVRNRGEVLPLRPEKTQKILLATHMRVFRKLLRKQSKGISIEQVVLRWAPSRQRRKNDTQKVLERARHVDAVVVGVSNSYYKHMVKLLKKRYPNKPVIVVSFGSPYMMTEFPDIDAYVCLYSYLDSAQVAGAATLLGTNQPQGVLPVTLPGLYPFGHGLSYTETAATKGKEGRAKRKAKGRQAYNVGRY